MQLKKHAGGCHCGSVRFEVLDPGSFEITGVRAIDGRNWEQHYPDGRGQY